MQGDLSFKAQELLPCPVGIACKSARMAPVSCRDVGRGTGRAGNTWGSPAAGWKHRLPSPLPARGPHQAVAKASEDRRDAGEARASRRSLLRGSTRHQSACDGSVPGSGESSCASPCQAPGARCPLCRGGQGGPFTTDNSEANGKINPVRFS